MRAVICIMALLVIASCRADNHSAVDPTGPSSNPTSKPRMSDPASASPEYLQLRLTLYNRTGMTMRIHLRFTEGDDSYNYVRSGNAYIGLFHDQDLVRRGKALVSRECKRLAAGLKPVSLAEAMLRPEDSAAFMDKLLKGETIASNLKSTSSVAKMSIACAEPHGAARMQEIEFSSVAELETLYGPMIAECMQIGDAAAAAAAKSK